jgi:hypothetical protein
MIRRVFLSCLLILGCGPALAAPWVYEAETKGHHRAYSVAEPEAYVLGFECGGPSTAIYIQTPEAYDTMATYPVSATVTVGGTESFKAKGVFEDRRAHLLVTIDSGVDQRAIDRLLALLGTDIAAVDVAFAGERGMQSHASFTTEGAAAALAETKAACGI